VACAVNPVAADPSLGSPFECALRIQLRCPAQLRVRFSKGFHEIGPRIGGAKKQRSAVKFDQAEGYNRLFDEGLVGLEPHYLFLQQVIYFWAAFSMRVKNERNHPLGLCLSLLRVNKR